MKKQELDNIDDDFGIDDDIKPKTDDIDNEFDQDFDNDLFSDDLGMDFDDNIGSTIDKKQDLLKNMTNFSPFIRDKINGWLGLRWSEQEQKFINDPDIDPIMNTKCAAWCIDYLKTYTRENNLITDIGKDEYKYIVIDIIEVVWYDIGCRCEYFGINSNEDLHRICVELEHAAELVLMGAGDGKYNKFFGSATSRHETVNLSQDGINMGRHAEVMPRKRGIVSKLKRAFGGV